MFKNALKHFRFIGILEGSSLVLLLFIAMPLKYWFDMPQAVTIVGTIHGYIFLAYMIAIVYAMIIVKWPFRFTIGATWFSIYSIWQLYFGQPSEKLRNKLT